MVATEEQISPSRITARLFAWLAPLLFLLAALAAVPVSATASAKALRVPQNRIGEHSAAAPLGMLPTIASPDWSKNLFVSNDPAHGISKFLGGQALTTLATAGTSELPEALSSGTEDVLAAGGTAAKDAEAAGAGAAARSEVPPEAASGAKAEATNGTKAVPEQSPVGNRVRANLAANRAALARTNLDRLAETEKGGATTGAAIHSRYPDGTPVHEGTQPGKTTGPDAEARGTPHTVLKRDSTGRVYKAREFGAGGVPKKDIDFTKPTYPTGKPRPGHSAPEQHRWIPNDPNNPRAGLRRGPGVPLSH